MDQNNLNVQPVEQPKNNKKGILIAIIALVVIAAIVVGVVLLGGDKGKETKEGDKATESTEKTNSSKIKDIVFETGKVVAMDENGDIYLAQVAQSESSKDFKYYGFEKEPEYPAKVASNAKELIDTEVYLSKDGEVYVTKLKIDGGVHREFTKYNSNIKKAGTTSGFCYGYLDNDGKLYVENGYISEIYCGLNKSYKEPTIIAENVKNIEVGYNATYYINENDELYMFSNEETTKIMDNVKSVVQSGYDNAIIYTKNNEIYEIITESVKISYDVYMPEFKETKLLLSDVESYDNGLMKTSNGDLYMLTNVCSSLDYAGVLTCEKESRLTKIDTKKLNDIGEILAFQRFSKYKLIYKTTNGKIKLVEMNEKSENFIRTTFVESEKELDNSIDSIYEIAKFYDYNRS